MVSHNRFQLLALRPSSVFYAYLYRQLGKEIVPKRELLDVDLTLVKLPLVQDHQSLVRMIEQHSAWLFTHELKRWLGPSVKDPIVNSFADFSLCFEFELHSHVALHGSMNQSQMGLGVKPNQACLQWLKKHQSYQSVNLDLARLQENHSIVLLSQNTLSDLPSHCQAHYGDYVELERKRLGLSGEHFKQAFSEQPFFTFSIHQQLLSLPNKPMSYMTKLRGWLQPTLVKE